MVPVGSCGKAHGIRGEVAVFTQLPEVFRPGAEVQIDGGGVLTVLSARPHKDHLIVAFDQILDRTAAEALRNMKLSAVTSALPELDSDEFWVSDLVGLQVQDRDGSQLGIVAEVITDAPQDRIVVDTGHGRIEVPFVPELVPEVWDTHIVVDPPDGLFES